MLHDSTYEYLKPTEQQLADMTSLREAALAYSRAVDRYVPDGPDKTYLLRKHREVAMWANVAVTRNPDGTPRNEPSAL